MDNPWKRLSTINPQREEGHREISNAVYAALIKADLTGGEYKVTLAVIEKTWGFHKKSDCISCSQLSGLTGLSGRSVNIIIKRLKEKRIIYYEPSRVNGSSSLNCGSPLNEFIFNKHYDTWQGCSVVQGVKCSSGVKQTVVKGEANGILRVKRSSATKETLTKETIQKKVVATENSLRLSLFLFSFIRERNNGHKAPDLNKWGMEIDRMIKIDGRDPPEIEKVIEWCQEDDFWQNNILSTVKLRKQYDQLVLKMKSTKGEDLEAWVQRQSLRE